MLLSITRWDLQQMRQERMQESLKQRQKNRDDPKSSGSTSSRPNEISINSLHPSSGNGNLTLDLNHDSCKNILIALYSYKTRRVAKLVHSIYTK